MISLKDKVFMPDCSGNDVDIDLYFTKGKTFGHFEENGRAYVITDRNTPRTWVQYLCNDKVRSAVSNVGGGYLYHVKSVNLTKQYETVPGNYMPRNYNGRRYLTVSGEGFETEFFSQADNFTCTVRPGYVTFDGDVKDMHIQVVIFVPENAPCECWRINVKGKVTEAVKLTACQEASLSKDQFEGAETFGDLRVTTGDITSIFFADKADSTSARKVQEDNYHFILKESIDVNANLKEMEEFNWLVVSGGVSDGEEEAEVMAFLRNSVYDEELKKTKEKWDKIINENYCVLPDKNAEYFLNVWLKNQVHLTFRYDRGEKFTGYRDGMQDSWGNLLVQPEKTKEKMLMCLSYMMSDGRCPRQIDRFKGEHDMRDFSDSPIWIPITLNSYIKLTGDFGVLEEVLPFMDSADVSTVENHIYRALDYLYNSRGKNGLIRIRRGDWADGLGGINQYGEDATSVWLTIAAYYAQNLMAEIYKENGCNEKAREMEKRSAEYKQLVNSVGWDGNWLIYGFFEDGEAIGSKDNLEGKIWLNPQTWGIFTGIIDDKQKIDKMVRSVSRYLDTPFGAMVNYPPYVFYGERCGRIQKQSPGQFLNSSIYNHAASFKVFSDVKRGAYEDAMDTFSRCIPNHPDNSDTCRTSEPFCVGNVYYGPNNHRYGMNLFSWYTAAPSWLIHGGFEEILGVKPTFMGLEITPHVSEDWDGYSVRKVYRGTTYNITFEKSAHEKGIWKDGEKQPGNVVYSEKESCNVIVKY